MSKKKQTAIIDFDGWYTAANAAQQLSVKSGKEVKPEYVRSLARLNKIATKKIGERTTLYNKADVDAYLVEDRGDKVVRAQKARSRGKAIEA